jgi:hypothetical protein
MVMYVSMYSSVFIFYHLNYSTDFDGIWYCGSTQQLSMNLVGFKVITAVAMKSYILLLFDPEDRSDIFPKLRPIFDGIYGVTSPNYLRPDRVSPLFP